MASLAPTPPAGALGAPPRLEDACARNVLVPPVVSSFFGQRIRCSRSGLDSQRKGKGIWRSVADMVVVDGAAVKTEEKSPEPSPPVPEEQPPKSFLSEVSNFVKLVDSKDIVELELKHKDYEIVIRKAEALAPPPAPAAAAPPQLPYAAYPPYPVPPPYGAYGPPAPPSPSPAPAPTESAPASEPAPVAPTPQYPTLKSPMAGNFYRSPGPGEPAFVKVGDKIRKGQVVCIIEAMKTMNTIESDQDGTIVEIIAEDGKSVAADAPLFSIKP